MKTEPIPRPRDDNRAAVIPSPTFPPSPPSSLILHPSSFPPPRKARRKPHLLWEQYDLATGGALSRNAAALARKWTTLTPMELRVCALVKAMLPSWRIAQILGICEDTVENHRVNARRKMRISTGKTLTHYLAML